MTEMELHLQPCKKSPRVSKNAGGAGGGGGGGAAGRTAPNRRDKNYHTALRAAVADKQRYFMHDGVFQDSSNGKRVEIQAEAAENETDSVYSGCHSPARDRSAQPVPTIVARAAHQAACRENCIDSGATKSIAHTSQAYAQLVATATCIITATGARTGPARKVELALRCRATQGALHTLKVPDTVFLPEIDVTLLSFGQLLELGYQPVLKRAGGYLLTPQGARLALQRRSPQDPWELPEESGCAEVPGMAELGVGSTPRNLQAPSQLAKSCNPFDVLGLAGTEEQDEEESAPRGKMSEASADDHSLVAGWHSKLAHCSTRKLLKIARSR